MAEPANSHGSGEQIWNTGGSFHPFAPGHQHGYAKAVINTNADTDADQKADDKAHAKTDARLDHSRTKFALAL